MKSQSGKEERTWKELIGNEEVSKWIWTYNVMNMPGMKILYKLKEIIEDEVRK